MSDGVLELFEIGIDVFVFARSSHREDTGATRSSPEDVTPAAPFLPKDVTIVALT